MKDTLIKHIKPYGYIHWSYIWKVIERFGRYYIIDQYGSRLEIEESTYKELKHD